MRQTGDLIPDMCRINPFPFRISESTGNLLNLSGKYGPIKIPDNQLAGGLSMKSGVLGAGTFYPASGSLDELLRLFYSVKSWQLTYNLSAQESFIELPGCELDLLQNQEAIHFLDYSIFNENNSKNLHLLDYYSNSNSKDIYTIKTDDFFNPISNVDCYPSDPIQKWQDLFCRKRYFTWSPPQDLINKFNSGLYFNDPNYTNNPYILQFLAEFELDGGDGVSNCYPTFLDLAVYSYFQLSIMNPEFLTYTGIGLGFTPETGLEKLNPDSGNFNNFFGSVWESGYNLTDKWGQIIGYGQKNLPIVDVQNVYHKEYVEKNIEGDINDLDVNFNPPYNKSYYPLIYFCSNVKTAPSNAPFTIPDIFISTKVQSENALPIGVLNIYDTLIGDSLIQTNSSNNPISGLATRLMFSLPLFSSTNTLTYSINVNLTPTQFWISNSGLNSGILN